MTSKKRKHIEQWNEQIIRFYPGSKMPMTITFQVTDACNLACTYCYQTHKGTRRMPFSVAKEFIDNLFDGKYDNYVDPSMPGIILEFIGGEPLLEFHLIDQIIEYFRTKAIELHHKWATCFCVSMCSNGTLYFEPGVREFLLKHRNHMSFSITIDGNKELHDSCRVFHDGSPSYDIAMAAVRDWVATGAEMGSKITLSPYNIEHAYKAITHMYEEGYTEIFSNCVFEEGWTLEHATMLYEIMKQLADYILEHNYEYSHMLSLFEENSFKPMPESENQNWCGGDGKMLSIDADGDLYPCIRFMHSSLGDSQKPLKIGSVKDGIGVKECDKDCLSCLKGITRRAQSTDECFYCPIAQGCSWCFPAGTKVNTPDGLKDIETLQPGDLVIDMYGNPQKVINNFSRQVTKEESTYVKAAGLYDLPCTKEHPFYTRPVEKRHNNYPIYGTPQWVHAGDLNITDKISLYVPKLGNKDINKEIAYLVGRYIGDGYKISSYRKKHQYRYYITCAFEEGTELEIHLNNANVLWHRDKQRTNYAYNINITNNEFLISVLDQCGRYAEDKHVPPCVWKWNKKSVKALLQGYFDADGSYDNKKGQRYSSINYELVLNISELVRAVYHTNVNISKRTPPEQSTIEGRIVNQSVSYEGSFKQPDELAKKYFEFDEDNNVMWVNVSKSKKDLPETMTVYNLNVENTHSYIANGAIVHNCSAYNYEVNGTLNKRVTYICVMHQARALANIYYWNKVYLKYNEHKVFRNHVPEEWALKIIAKDEWDMLQCLEQEAGNCVPGNKTMEQ